MTDRFILVWQSRRSCSVVVLGHQSRLAVRLIPSFGTNLPENFMIVASLLTHLTCVWHFGVFEYFLVKFLIFLECSRLYISTVSL